MLQPTYNCITPSGAMTPPPIGTEMAVPANTWTRLQGTATFPPADAPVGCKLLVAAVYVRHDGTACSGPPCPDLFIDDVSITLAPLSRWRVPPRRGALSVFRPHVRSSRH